MLALLQYKNACGGFHFSHFFQVFFFSSSSFVFISGATLCAFNGLSSPRDDEEIHADSAAMEIVVVEGVDRTVLRQERSADGVSSPPASSIQSAAQHIKRKEKKMEIYNQNNQPTPNRATQLKYIDRIYYTTTGWLASYSRIDTRSSPEEVEKKSRNEDWREREREKRQKSDYAWLIQKKEEEEEKKTETELLLLLGLACHPPSFLRDCHST